LIELSKEQMHSLSALCRDKLDVVLWSCVEGKMGRAWVNCVDKPAAAVVVAADFCFLLGSAKDFKDEIRIKELLDKFRGKIIVAEDAFWVSVLEKYYRDTLRRFNRYAIKKESDVFHRDKLNRFIAAVEPEFRVDRIDEVLYYKALEDKFMEDCCSNFSSLEEFLKHGIGYAVVKDGDIIAAASSYSYCEGAIEITIGTKEAYRRKGLGQACASKLIMECLDKNIYPRWDAANLGSVALAEKLGYHFDKEYEVYCF
jgi:GNAT superfamily N-acetyltransferase